MTLSGAAWALKSILGEETFNQIEGLANDGTFAKIVAFAENGEALTNLVANLKETLERLEQKFDDFAKSFDEPASASQAFHTAATVAGPGSLSAIGTDIGGGSISSAVESGEKVEETERSSVPSDSAWQPPEQSQSNPGERPDELGGEPAVHGSGVPGNDGAAGQPGTGEPSTGATNGGGSEYRSPSEQPGGDFGIGGF